MSSANNATEQHIRQYFDVRNGPYPYTIPFRSIVAMNAADDVLCDCIRQIVVVLFTLHRLSRNRLFFYHVDLDAISIRQCPIKHFVLPVDTTTTTREYFWLSAASGYLVAFDWDKILPIHADLDRRTYPAARFHVHHRVCRQSIFLQVMKGVAGMFEAKKEHKCVLDDDNNNNYHAPGSSFPRTKVLILLSQRLSLPRISPPIPVLMQDEIVTPLLWNALTSYSLRVQESLSWDKNVLDSSFQNIHRHFQVFCTPFKNRDNANAVFCEWLGIVGNHFHEFMDILSSSSSPNDEARIAALTSRLKTYLHQLLVDRHCQHIRINNIDVHSLVLSIFQWVPLYSKWLVCRSNLFRPDIDQADRVFMAVCDLFLFPDTLETNDDMMIIDPRQACSEMVVSCHQDLVRMHPFYRTEYFK